MSLRDASHYEGMVCLFEYPDRDFPARVDAILAVLGECCPEALAELEVFRGFLPTQGAAFSSDELDEMQEIFTRSFDVQSVTTLDIGYVAFGDDYKRGELLVNLNRECRQAGVDCGSELADHLPNILRLIARWDDSELVAELVSEIVHPALEQMIEEFDSRRIVQRNALYKKHYKTLIDWSPQRAVIYRNALSCLLILIRQDFELSDLPAPQETSDFLRSITRELDIEAAGEGRRPSAAQPQANTQGCPVQLPSRSQP